MIDPAMLLMIVISIATFWFQLSLMIGLISFGVLFFSNIEDGGNNYNNEGGTMINDR